MNDKEYAKLKRKANAAGLGLDPFIRKLVAGTEIKPRPPDETSYNRTWLHTDRFSICIYDPELAEAIRSLVPRQRNIILLCYFAEYSDRETGDILGLPVHVIRCGRQAALRKLKEMLTAINYEQ